MNTSDSYLCIRPARAGTPPRPWWWCCPRTRPAPSSSAWRQGGKIKWVRFSPLAQVKLAVTSQPIASAGRFFKCQRQRVYLATSVVLTSFKPRTVIKAEMQSNRWNDVGWVWTLFPWPPDFLRYRRASCNNVRDVSSSELRTGQQNGKCTYNQGKCARFKTRSSTKWQRAASLRALVVNNGSKTDFRFRYVTGKVPFMRCITDCPSSSNQLTGLFFSAVMLRLRGNVFFILYYYYIV